MSAATLIAEAPMGIFDSGVLKKNGKNNRLCIDYKRVNTITAIMEYAMPLVDDLLTELGHYLWFCSLMLRVGSGR
ncbi:hypothetical protein PC129_g18793 [Phytophthora cactorum]|uniref:Reverse transcriptase domain-containing protein n=1 Tax=Phytophthora cactorum TaxID=29920 RepID=A0A8T1F594_9STRA|nr:hypothetical protein PC114_g21497 [Phytophthora cactorum]KAG2968525.1 hypothetical protein PC118_g17965 [Phytophthora cactorum]KAG3210206.1 hypothetical protein PC129_g18793 [Phytophthora cactorum]